MILKNKRGGIVLRDVIFMILMFSGIIAFSSILVTQMGTEYNNPGMVSSFNQEEIGKEALVSSGNEWEGIAEDLSGKNGIPSMLKGGLEGIGVVLIEVVKAPHTFSKMVTSTLDIFGVTEEMTNIATFVLTALLYSLIVFAIVKVFLRGGDI